MSDVQLLQIYLKPGLKIAVQTFSKKRGQTASQFVREALREKFEIMKVQTHDIEDDYGIQRREEIYEEESEERKSREVAKKKAVQQKKVEPKPEPPSAPTPAAQPEPEPALAETPQSAGQAEAPEPPAEPKKRGRPAKFEKAK